MARYRWVESGNAANSYSYYLPFRGHLPLDAVLYHIDLLVLTMIYRQAGSAL